MADAEGLCTAEGAGDLLIPIFAKSLHTEYVRFTSEVSGLTARLQPLEYPRLSFVFVIFPSSLFNFFFPTYSFFDVYSRHCLTTPKDSL